jgi:hypothetical protein
MSETFIIPCKGRMPNRKDALNEPVEAKITVCQFGIAIIMNVKCPYNTGDQGQRCKASHPEVDKLGEGVICPYSIDLPYAIDNVDYLKP